MSVLGRLGVLNLFLARGFIENLSVYGRNTSVPLVVWRTHECSSSQVLIKQKTNYILFERGLSGEIRSLLVNNTKLFTYYRYEYIDWFDRIFRIFSSTAVLIQIDLQLAAVDTYLRVQNIIINPNNAYNYVNVYQPDDYVAKRHFLKPFSQFLGTFTYNGTLDVRTLEIQVWTLNADIFYSFPATSREITCFSDPPHRLICNPGAVFWRNIIIMMCMR